jgi:hypothetical protein
VYGPTPWLKDMGREMGQTKIKNKGRGEVPATLNSLSGLDFVVVYQLTSKSHRIFNNYVPGSTA